MAAQIKFKVPDDVRAVLAEAEITATSVKLVVQLDRSLYAKVNKVLTAAGGKWSRKDQVHVFPRDPREILGLAVTQGVGTNVRTKLQAFYTPPGVAQALVVLALPLIDAPSVLEPSAGEGSLALAIRSCRPKANVRCVDVDQLSVDKLLAIGFKAECADFLSLVPSSRKRFDRVIMNPPFQNGQDQAHVLHAFRFLKPGGRLVAIVSARSNEIEADSFEYRRLLKFHGMDHGELEPGTFRASGTNVRTRVISLQAPVS